MIELDPRQRRDLRARAHHLHPVVSIGQHGLTPAVLHEIDVALTAHALVKVRVHSDDRDAREAMLAGICGQLHAAPVQHLGKLLLLWRPRDEDGHEDEVVKPVKRAPGDAPAARNRKGPRPAKDVQPAAEPRRRRRVARKAPLGTFDDRAPALPRAATGTARKPAPPKGRASATGALRRGASAESKGAARQSSTKGAARQSSTAAGSPSGGARGAPKPRRRRG
jgi:RNA-binding protein